MGSFNVSGAVSKLSIGCGDKVAFFILRPLVAKLQRCAIVSNSPTTGMYDCAFLPVIGYYNDYGNIENVERDSNVEYIETHFDQPIEDIISSIWDGESEYAGMWENYEFYERSAAFSLNGDYNIMELQIFGKPQFLKLLGFELIEELDSNERYKYKYQHVTNGVCIQADESGFVDSIGKNNMFSPNHLIEYYRENGITDYGFDMNEVRKHSVVYASLLELQSLPKSNYDKEYAKSLPILEMIEYAINFGSSATKGLKDMYDQMKGKHDEDAIRDMVNIVATYSTKYNRNYDVLRNMEYVADLDLYDDFERYVLFDHFMFSVNAYYMPSGCGPQCGDWEATREMGKLLAEISNRRCLDSDPE